MLKRNHASRNKAILDDIRKNHNHSWYEELLLRNKMHLEKTALLFRDTEISYGEFFDMVEIYAKSLKRLGIQKEDYTNEKAYRLPIHRSKTYYGEPELTKNAKFTFQGKKYLKTGTMGTLDEEGYFTLTGRASRFYIRSDFNKVYCEHIQGAISQIDCVKACAVVKKSDEKLLYVSKAYIVLEDGVKAEDGMKERILNECRSQTMANVTGEIIQIKEFEIPSEIVFIDSLPRTRADKIDYELLEKGNGTRV